MTIEVDNKIVGSAGYFVNESDRSGRITWIFFDPNHSGLGLGREIVEHCIKLLNKDTKVEKLIVTTSQLAYRFFEKFDYEIINNTYKILYI